MDNIIDNISTDETRQSYGNTETEAAIQEARAIMNGQIQAKHYPSVRALFEELDAEMCDDCQ